VADSVAYPDRQMTAAELLEFWKSARIMAMTTVGPAGQPHTAPVHSTLAGTTLTLVIYDNTVRREDLKTNPRVSFTTWKDGALRCPQGPHEVPGRGPGRTSGAPRSGDHRGELTGLRDAGTQTGGGAKPRLRPHGVYDPGSRPGPFWSPAGGADR
jgi:hypothetical protein